MNDTRFKNIGLCCLLGVACEFFSSYALGFILEAMPGAADKYSSDMSALFTDEITTIVLVALVMPILEELIFRLLIFKALKKVLPFIAANLIQAALFGIYHMNLIQGIYAFLLGLLLGLLCERAQTFLTCISFHCAFNITGLLIDDYMPAGLHTAAKAVIMLASLAAGIFIFLNLKHQTDEPVQC